MRESNNPRADRILRLLAELEYEVTRGVMEREIEPDLHLSKLLPWGQECATFEFHVYPVSRDRYVPNTRPSVRLVSDRTEQAQNVNVAADVAAAPETE